MPPDHPLRNVCGTRTAACPADEVGNHPYMGVSRVTNQASEWVARVDREKIVEVAKELVSIPSVSGDELEVMTFVQRWLDHRGIGYVVTAKDPTRPNVIATVGEVGSGPLVTMNGHLDTVPI